MKKNPKRVRVPETEREEEEQRIGGGRVVRRRKGRCGGEEKRSLEIEVRVVGREINVEFIVQVTFV